MIDIEFSVTDPGLVDAYAELCRHVPDFVNTVTNQAVNVVGPLALDDFRQEPGAVKTPIKWTSAKQRRYVMMLKRMGLIPSPYVRTHALAKGWTLTVVYTPGELSSIELTNPVEYATYVIGLRRQDFHATTGWYYAPDKAAEWVAIFTDEVERALVKAWYAVDDIKQGAY